MAKNSDPFEDQGKVTKVEQGEITIGTRIRDIVPEVPLVKLEDFQGQDLIVHNTVHRKNGEFGDYLTCEVSPAEDISQRYLVNVGGTVVVPKIQRAFKLLEEGKVLPPLVVSFVSKTTGGGRTFWDIE